MNDIIYKKRKIINLLGQGFSAFAMVTSLFVLTWILYSLVIKGLGAFDLNVLFKDTPPPGEDGGGLRNAIVGSLMIVGATILISTPIGVLAGIYLAEYGDRNWFGKFTAFVTDVMLSAPSIVIGLFIWIVAVQPFKVFSGWAGSLALAMLSIPVIVRTTQNMMQLVQGSLREAAFALGMPEWRVYIEVCLKAVRSGVLTGILLSLARIIGETAPLMFTAFSNQFFSTDMSKPMANLPYVIFQFAMSPYDNWNRLAWAGAFLITLFVLILNIVARLMSPKKSDR